MQASSYTSTSISSGDALGQAPQEPVKSGASGKRYILVALFLLALPLLTIAYQSHRIDTGTLIRLPATIQRVNPSSLNIDTVFAKTRLSTPLNHISKTLLSGSVHFRSGDAVFVFLSPGPNNIWYPYAASKRPPKRRCHVKSCLVLSGEIIETQPDTLHIRYQYEAFIPAPKLATRLDEAHENMEVVLSVGLDGRTSVKGLNVDGDVFDQRKLPIYALSGFNHWTANAAPVR